MSGHALAGAAGGDAQIRLVELVHGDLLRERLDASWRWSRKRGLDVVGARVERVNLDKEGRATLECEVDLAQGPDRLRSQTVFVEQCRHSVEQVVGRLRKNRRAQLRGGGDDTIVDNLGDGWLVRIPGYDERLKGLCLVHDKAPRCWPARLFPGTAPVAAELLGHRLGRRAIGRIEIDDGCQQRRMIFKAFKDRGERHRRAAAILDRLRGLLPSRRCGVPRVLGVCDTLHTLFMEQLPGIPLIEAGAAQPGAWRRAGAALRALHDADIPAPGYRAEDESEMLERRVAAVSALFPALSEELRGAFRRVSRELLSLPSVEPRLVHRDFHEKQILLDEQRLWMIDFDTLALADPALDLGNLAAHIELNHLQGIAVDGAMEQFLAGYAPDPSLDARLGPWTRAASLRLVCLYLPGRWRPVALKLLERLGD